MQKQNIGFISVLILTFALAGCTVRTYSLTRDRVDQNLGIGNCGYLQGKIPAQPEKERNRTRTTHVMEIELGPAAKCKAKTASTIKQDLNASVQEALSPEGDNIFTQTPQSPTAKAGDFQTYTVQKDDTLQKISLKFYGTTKKWGKIYNANKDLLKAHDKIYVGQILNVPNSYRVVEKEKANLK